jgi:hypothetical protein
MTLVDKLSKSLNFSLSEEAASRLSLSLSREVISVDYGKIHNLIEIILGSRRKCAIVVPKWPNMCKDESGILIFPAFIDIKTQAD